MLRPRPILLFVCGFIVIYGLLLAPWPGWEEFYGEYFRAEGNAVFGSDKDRRVLRFEAFRQTQGLSSVDSRIVMGNRDKAASDGKMPVEMLGLDSRGIGWVPTALTIALIAASPIPWRRRAIALLGGLALIHLFIMGSVAVYIWDELPGVSLVIFSPFWQQVMDGLQYTLITQYGASFYVPVLIWMLVTFNRKDFRRSTEEAGAGKWAKTN